MKEKAKIEIQRLIDLFNTNKTTYMNKAGEQGEREVEEDLITPFFKALGWFSNESDVLALKDVRLQYSVTLKRGIERDGSGVKKVDYAFRLNGVDQFFVEVKVPNRDLRPKDNKSITKDTIESIWQAKTYGWSKNVPIVILMDFEEFRVFNTIQKPQKNKYWNQIIPELDFDYDNYIENFHLIWDTFSKEAVINGSLEKFKQKRKGIAKQTIDDALLDTINNWRESLAENIAYNLKKEKEPQLSSIELTEAVQTIIDRIIFIRFLEDNHIENNLYLKKYFDPNDPGFTKQKDIYKRLVSDFPLLATDYNGGIFGKDRDDRHFSEKLQISDKTIKIILKELYDDSPFDFSIIPIDILGQIYEQFLGKIITVTPGGSVDVILKESVRKAGGVYYTPKYIVDYIVDETVGKKLKGLSPNQISKLKIMDIACGSGTFLIGVFERLILEHENFYSICYKNKDLKRKDKDWFLIEEELVETNEKSGKITEKKITRIVLTVEKKTDILLNNIFGIDIDKQAVEVTKMSLYFKLLADESYETKQQFLGGFNKHLLPSLDSNIKNGNSLIDFSIKSQENIQNLDTHDKNIALSDINPFDLEKSFPNIFQNDGGIDVIVGNPPYIKIQSLFEFQPLAVPFLKATYFSAKSKNIDIYVMFLERAFAKLKKDGMLGYILPYKFFHEDMGENIRNHLAKSQAINKIINFGANQIFDDATTYTCLFFLQKKKNKNFDFYEFNLNDDIQTKLPITKFEKLDHAESMKEKWHFTSKAKAEILSKLQNQSLKLQDITRKIFVGLQTSADKIYILYNTSATVHNGKTIKLFSKSLNTEVEIETDFIKPFLLGKNLKRYATAANDCYVIFPYIVNNLKATLMTTSHIKSNFPLAWHYLEQNKSGLENRENGKMKGKGFYAYIYPKNLAEFDAVKIMTPDISDNCNFVLDDVGNMYHTTTIYSLAFNNKANCDTLFYLGLFNSSLFRFFVYATGTILRGGFTRFKTQYMNDFPIIELDLKNKVNKKVHDDIIELVKEILDLKQQIVTLRSDKEISKKNDLIKDSEHDIDTKVFGLYNLSDVEAEFIRSAYLPTSQN